MTAATKNQKERCAQGWARPMQPVRLAWKIAYADMRHLEPKSRAPSSRLQRRSRCYADSIQLSKTDLVDQIGGSLLVFGDLRQRQGVGLQQAVAADDVRIDLDASLHRIFEVGVGIKVLCRVAPQRDPLNQLRGVGFVRRAFWPTRRRRRSRAYRRRQRSAGLREVAQAQSLLVSCCVFMSAPVIGVARCMISHLPAATSRACSRSPPDGFCARLAFTPAQPFLGFRFAVLGDHRGNHRVVIDVLTGADTDLAFPLRVGELLIGDRVLLHAILRRIHHARAHGDTVPAAFRVAILRWDNLIEHGRLDRLGNARVDGVARGGQYRQ